ncbi:hypothetical protein Tco_1000406 [Tanacetum coccineum]
MKDHPLEQVRGNPSKPVQPRRQIAINPEMCMFALTVSTAEPKNIKEAMANSAWIQAMQEELHQFDRLQERISHKKTKNQSKRDKTEHGMEKCVKTKPNQRADYANWETSFIKERKWEKENEKRKDVEGPFLYTSQTYP